MTDNIILVPDVHLRIDIYIPDTGTPQCLVTTHIYYDMIDYIPYAVPYIPWLIIIFLIDFRLREERGERERDIDFVFPLTVAFIGWLLFVALQGLKPTTLVYQHNALTNWAAWSGPDLFYNLQLVLLNPFHFFHSSSHHTPQCSLFHAREKGQWKAVRFCFAMPWWQHLHSLPSGLCYLSSSPYNVVLRDLDRLDIPQNNKLVHCINDIMLLAHKQEVVKAPSLPESGR